MSTNVNPRQNSITHMILNNEKGTKIIDESLENRFRTYNVKELKMAKTYLPDDVIRDFKKGFEASSSKSSSSTPKSRNFVKKLVATLENKKYQGSGHCTADNEFFTKCYSRPFSKNHVSYENQEKKKNYFEEKYNPNVEKSKENILKRKEKDFEVSKQGATMNLTIDEYINLNSAKNIYKKKETSEKRRSFWSSKSEGKIKEANNDSLSSTGSENIQFRRNFHQTSNETISIKSDKSDNLSNIFNETKNKKNVFRRSEQFEEKKSFKNILSSLIGLKSRNPSLPKGKRNIFSPKESLGEEMRVFRRDMMPALLKAAKSYKSEFDDVPSDDTFSSMINATSKPQFDYRSASIHPFYGGKRASTFLHPLSEENFEFQSGSSQEKRISHSTDQYDVPLRENSRQFYQNPLEVIYDVPKSNKKLNLQSVGKNDENAYENTDIITDTNYHKIINPSTRKNIICGRRALFIQKRKQEKKL